MAISIQGGEILKVLVYGAGVIAAYLAYELKKKNEDVTILARGERYKELKENGLIIKHYLQKRKTITDIKVIDSFKSDDYYDVVFIVMQSYQVKEILPIIYANKICKAYVFIGNNFEGGKIYKEIEEKSFSKPKVLFGFLGVGGRRENGTVISIHKGKSTLAMGSVNNEYSIEKVNRIFKDSNIKLEHYDNIDSYLKYHIAYILPIVYLCHHVNGNLKEAAHNKPLIKDTVEAIIEGYRVLQSLNITSEPIDYLEDMESSRKKYYYLYKLMLMTPIGKLAFGNRAMNAIKEMNFLAEAFDELKASSPIDTPYYNKLRKDLKKCNY